MKKCTLCGIEKELTEFCKHKGRKFGVAEQCKPCRNAKMIAERYGISIEERDKLIKKQSNLCAICGNSETVTHQSGQVRDLSIDHCHTTGKIRGLLCGSCNNGLGRFKDSIENLERAIKYLKENS